MLEQLNIVLYFDNLQIHLVEAEGNPKMAHLNWPVEEHGNALLPKAGCRAQHQHVVPDALCIEVVQSHMTWLRQQHRVIHLRGILVEQNLQEMWWQQWWSLVPR